MGQLPDLVHLMNKDGDSKVADKKDKKDDVIQSPDPEKVVAATSGKADEKDKSAASKSKSKSSKKKAKPTPSVKKISLPKEATKDVFLVVADQGCIDREALLEMLPKGTLICWTRKAFVGKVPEPIRIFRGTDVKYITDYVKEMVPYALYPYVVE